MGGARLNGFPSFVERTDQNLNRLRVKTLSAPSVLTSLSIASPLLLASCR